MTQTLPQIEPIVALLGAHRSVTVTPVHGTEADGIGRIAVADHEVGEPQGALLDDIAQRIGRGDEDPTRHALLLARDDSGAVVAVGGYEANDPGHATLVCAVRRRHRNLGLGTFLLRRLAELARANGIGRFHVTATSNGPIEMLRDCGLRAHWELGRPLEVELELEGRRPGWATPEVPTAAPPRS